jgi:hypothetical protein
MQRPAYEAPSGTAICSGSGVCGGRTSITSSTRDGYVELNRQADKKRSLLRGRTMINCFFDSSTRIRTSFEIARQARRRGREKSWLLDLAGPAVHGFNSVSRQSSNLRP